MSEYAFKKRVAIACKTYTFKQLIDQKNEVKNDKGRKGKNLEYNKFKIQDYFTSGKLKISEIKLLNKIRTRILNVKANFPHMYANDQDPLNCENCPEGVLDTQEHIVLCDGLKKKVNINYNDLFSSNIDIIKEALTAFEVAWNQRPENL